MLRAYFNVIEGCFRRNILFGCCAQKLYRMSEGGNDGVMSLIRFSIRPVFLLNGKKRNPG